MLNAASVFGRTIPNVRVRLTQIAAGLEGLVLPVQHKLTHFCRTQYFADSYGPLNLLIPATLVSGIMIFCWIPAMMNSAGVVVWSVLFGAFQGAFVSMLPAGKSQHAQSTKYCRTCFRVLPEKKLTIERGLSAAVASLTDDMRTIGIRMAMAFLLQSTCALVGTPIAGYIISNRGGQAGYVGAGVYSGVIVLVGVGLITWARFETAKNKSTPYV